MNGCGCEDQDVLSAFRKFCTFHVEHFVMLACLINSLEFFLTDLAIDKNIKYFDLLRGFSLQNLYGGWPFLIFLLNKAAAMVTLVDLPICSKVESLPPSRAIQKVLQIAVVGFSLVLRL